MLTCSRFGSCAGVRLSVQMVRLRVQSMRCMLPRQVHCFTALEALLSHSGDESRLLDDHDVSVIALFDHDRPCAGPAPSYPANARCTACNAAACAPASLERPTPSAPALCRATAGE